VWFTSPTGSIAIDKVEDLVPLAAFALAALVCSRPSAHLDVRPLVAVIAVGVASAVLVGTDADLVTAALVLLGVVVLTAVTGIPSAVTAVVASYLALNYWFTPPKGSLEISKADDLVPLLAFIIAAAASAGTVARINWLRQRAALVEQREFDARVAQATSEDRAMFLASMTHNLRTPLATIRASIAAVLSAPKDDTERRTTLLMNAQSETDRLDRLVTKVLQITRIHAGALEPNPETIELGELTGRAARRLQHLAGDRDVKVAVTSDELVFASVDPDMLELVIIVMLENALRYAPPRSQIDVVVDATTDHGARVRVSDHGPGIPPEHRKDVFDEFVRLDTDGSSSGLGLTIARSMIEAHDGTMWIEETPGGGASAVVLLPTVPTDGGA
jgi:K+-sensing histidine kinase KdpD